MIDSQPPPLMTSEPGSFARYTIVKRKPQITERVIADNGYLPHTVAAFGALRCESATQPIKPSAGWAPGTELWNRDHAAF